MAYALPKPDRPGKYGVVKVKRPKLRQQTRGDRIEAGEIARRNAAARAAAAARKKKKPPVAGSPGGAKNTPIVGSAAAPPDPYARFKGTPYQGYFEDFDRQQANHQNWLTGLLPQVSSGLAAITGVNPSSPGYNPVIQQQYLANVQGQVGGALNASAAATPFGPGSSSPGGIMAAPNAYQGAAMGEYARQRGGSAILNAQAQSTLNTLQPNIYAQAAYSKVADYAAGMPAVYAERRAKDMLAADQYLAEAKQAAADAAEEARHNRVTEAISGQNAQTNAAIQFGRLGLDTTRAGQDVVESAADRAATNARNAADNRTSTANNAADNAARAASDASAERRAAARAVSSGGTSTRDAKGRLLVPSLQEKGFRRIGPKKPPVKPGFIDVQGADGKWWRRPASSSTPAASKPKLRIDLSDDLRKRYKPGDGVEGWEAENVGNAHAAAAKVAEWVRKYKPSFISKGRKVDFKKIDAVLSDVLGHGTVFQEARRILKGYMTSDGRWK